MVFLGGVLRLKVWKYCVRHYPAWIRVCWCIACQNRSNGLSSRSVERFCVPKKLSGNLGYIGRSNPWDNLDQMKCGLWGDMVDVITCAIFGDCRLRGVGVVRGVSLPSPIDLSVALTTLDMEWYWIRNRTIKVLYTITDNVRRLYGKYFSKCNIDCKLLTIWAETGSKGKLPVHNTSTTSISFLTILLLHSQKQLDPLSQKHN